MTIDNKLTAKELEQLDITISPVQRILNSVAVMYSKNQLKEITEYLSRPVFDAHSELLIEVITIDPNSYNVLPEAKKLDLKMVEAYLRGLNNASKTADHFNQNVRFPFMSLWNKDFEGMKILLQKYPVLILRSPDEIMGDAKEVNHAIAGMPQLIDQIYFKGENCAGLKEFVLIALENAEKAPHPFNDVYSIVYDDLLMDIDVIKAGLKGLSSEYTQDILDYTANLIDDFTLAQMMKKPEMASILFYKNPEVLENIEDIWSVFEEDMPTRKQSAIAVRRGERELPTAYEFLEKSFVCPIDVRRKIASYLTKEETVKLSKIYQEIEEEDDNIENIVTVLEERLQEFQREKVSRISHDHVAKKATKRKRTTP